MLLLLFKVPGEVENNGAGAGKGFQQFRIWRWRTLTGCGVLAWLRVKRGVLAADKAAGGPTGLFPNKPAG